MAIGERDRGRGSRVVLVGLEEIGSNRKILNGAITGQCGGHVGRLK